MSRDGCTFPSLEFQFSKKIKKVFRCNPKRKLLSTSKTSNTNLKTHSAPSELAVILACHIPSFDQVLFCHVLVTCLTYIDRQGTIDLSIHLFVSESHWSSNFKPRLTQLGQPFCQVPHIHKVQVCTSEQNHQFQVHC